MAVPKKVLNFLEKAKINPFDKLRVKYEPIKHRTVYTAYDKAQTLKVKPNVIGKTLVLKIDKNMAIALIPGNKNLDKNKFKKTINEWHKKAGLRAIKNIDFISERVMKNKFKGVKLGAIPPFGAIWKLPTFVDKGLFRIPQIIVSAGDYSWSIKISPANLKKLIPDLVVGSFGKKK